MIVYDTRALGDIKSLQRSALERDPAERTAFLMKLAPGIGPCKAK